MNQEYYKEYYIMERTHWWFKVRQSLIKDIIDKSIFVKGTSKTDLRCLNVGVATGATTEMLSNYGDVTSIEYDRECLEFTAEKTGLVIQQGSITDLDFPDNYFDLVCAFDVIEHVEDDQKAALEISRVCKPGGFVVCTVPCFMHLWSEHDVINHHFRRYRLPHFLKLFPAEKMQVIYASYFNTLLFPMISLFRLGSRLITKKKIDSEPLSDMERTKNFTITNGLLSSIFGIERALIGTLVGLKIKLPFGVSCIASITKIDTKTPLEQQLQQHDN